MWNISPSAEARDVTLSKDEIEVYQSMPMKDQPVVPLENTFSFRGQRSTSYTLKMIEALDRTFFQQTGGLGVNRNIGTAKMLAMINKTLETGKNHLTDEEMDTYATSRILAYLHEIKSPRADNFAKALKTCETQKVSCEQSITFDELFGFIEKQKALILSKIKKPSQPQWIKATPSTRRSQALNIQNKKGKND